MANLSAKMIQALQKLDQLGGEAMLSHIGLNNTVRALNARGLVTCTVSSPHYNREFVPTAYNDHATVRFTEAGRAALKQTTEDSQADS